MSIDKELTSINGPYFFECFLYTAIYVSKIHDSFHGVVNHICEECTDIHVYLPNEILMRDNYFCLFLYDRHFHIPDGF